MLLLTLVGAGLGLVISSQAAKIKTTPLAEVLGGMWFTPTVVTLYSGARGLRRGGQVAEGLDKG